MIDGLGMFIYGALLFMMGRDYNPNDFKFDLDDTGVMIDEAPKAGADSSRQGVAA